MLVFELADLAQVPTIVGLVESAYRGDASRAGWTTEADLLDGQRTDQAAIVDLIQKSDSRILLALEDQAIVACAHIEKHGNHAYFGMFSVSPSQQARGIGKALLQECETRASALWRVSEMRMNVIWSRSELIEFYLRHGYRKTGERKPFPYGDARFGIPKRNDLWFEVLTKPLPQPSF